MDYPAHPDPFRTFHSLSGQFHHQYYIWHSTGQYEGVAEFSSAEHAYSNPPPRERDDWYREELAALDRYYHPLANSHTLEIGCGDGNLTWKLASRCHGVLAWDIDEKAILLTQTRVKELRLTNVVCQLRSVVEPDVVREGRYDLVFLVQVLEHLPRSMQAVAFDNALKLVAPGGCLFISTPNRWTFRDDHDIDRLFIHWLPRPVRVPIAKLLKIGVRGCDPCWPEPPVLHDYVSYRWMLARAKRLCPNVVVSRMLFYPTVDEWYQVASKRRHGSLGRSLRWSARWFGKVVPLNYYFGAKVIFKKPEGHDG